MEPQEVLDGLNQQPPDSDAWGWAYVNFFPQVLNTVKRTTRGSVESEDLTADVFVSLREHSEPFKSVENVSEFLYQVAVYKSISHNEKRDKEKRHAGKFGKYLEDLVEQNKENAFIDHHFDRLVYMMAEKLPRMCHNVFMSAYRDRLTNAQIARKWTITKRTVETHKTHAHQFLKIEMKKNGRYFHFILSLSL